MHCTYNMEVITIARDHLLERAGQSMGLCANIDASLDRWVALSVEDKDKMNRQLSEASEAIENYAELGVLSNLVVLSRHMKDRLCLVKPDAIHQQY